MYDGGMGGYGMDGGFGFGGLIVWIAVTILFLWLYARILGRAGFSPLWALVMLVPIVNLVMLWVFAFVRWPAVDRTGEPE